MDKIQITVQHGKEDLLVALGLKSGDAAKTAFANKCEQAVSNFKKVLKDELPAEGEGAYTRAHFAQDIIDIFNPAEIVFLALGTLESTAVDQVKAEMAREGLGKVLEALEGVMSEKGIDVAAMKADMDALKAEGKSGEEIAEIMRSQESKYNSKPQLEELEDCKETSAE